MKNNNTLSRTRQILLPMACSLMEKSPHFEHLHEGAVLHLKVVNDFKAVFQWFGRHGEGEELFMTLDTQGPRPPVLSELYEVVMIRNPFMRIWRKYTLGGKYYLRQLEADFEDRSKFMLRRFKTREIML